MPNHSSYESQTLRMTLLAATLGLAVGVCEGGFLRLTPRITGLQQPDVSNMIWFLAPLVACLAFATFGLAAGLIASRLNRPWASRVGIAFLWGSAGAYLATSVELSQAGSGWVLQAHDFARTSAWFLVLFVWAFLAMWILNYKEKVRLVSLLRFRLRPWALTLLLIIAIAGAGVTFTSYRIPSVIPAPSAASRAAPDLPNVVFITWDTVRADHLSAYGYSRPTTPNLDKLASQGVVFENAISSSSWTLPSFASMFTGLLPHQHGANVATPLDSGPRTLAEILQMRGYETAGFNANTYNGLAGWGIADGFETYRDVSSSPGHNLATTVVGRTLLQPAYQTLVRYDFFDRPDAEQVNQQVYRWYRRRSQRPYFLFVNYFDAHLPYSVPRPFDHRFGQVSSRLLRQLVSLDFGRFPQPPSTEDQQSMIAAYDNGLAYVDAKCGELLQFLAGRPEWKKTIVIITSDHGEGFGEHGTYLHGWNLYHELLHVPLVIYGLGIPAGVRVSYITRTRELFATILDITAQPGAIFRRTTLRRFWSPEFAPLPFDEIIVSEVSTYTPTHPGQGCISLVTPEWHYLHFTAGKVELYRWPNDPLEQNNLADSAEGQSVVRELRRRLRDHIGRSLRPWRGLPYLIALDGPRYSIVREAHRVVPWDLTQLMRDPPAGASQAFFHPDPGTSPPRPERVEDELVRSLPYQ